MRTDQVQIITDGDMAATINSNGVDVGQMVLCSIQAVYTGSPVGTLKVQVSNDIVNYGLTNPSSNVVNWSDYPVSATAVSTAGNSLYLIADVSFRWIRFVYTKTSGTGTLNAIFYGKGV